MAYQFRDETISYRRLFHQYPELGFHENRTSETIASFLKTEGIEYRAGIAKTGLIARIDGKYERPLGMIRFDMDALPIQEETGLEFSSRNSGVMHACGHDGHMAIGLTVCKILKEMQNELNGSIRCIFQPAEEGDGGAALMIKEHVLENPKPDFILGMHLWNEKPVGWIGIKSGPVMAASDIFEITVTGKGGHGGNPARVNDPVVCTAQIILGLQTIISRNLSPFEHAVVSITYVSGGTTYNVIPERVVIEGTIRSFEQETREKIHRRIDEICENIAAASGCKSQVMIQGVTSAVVNNKEIAEEICNFIAEAYPSFDVDRDYQTTISEDMALYQEQVPGCFLLVGSANPAKGLVQGHHHPKFDFDEDILTTASSLLSDLCVHLLNK